MQPKDPKLTIPERARALGARLRRLSPLAQGRALRLFLDRVCSDRVDNSDRTAEHLEYLEALIEASEKADQGE